MSGLPKAPKSTQEVPKAPETSKKKPLMLSQVFKATTDYWNTPLEECIIKSMPIIQFHGVPFRDLGGLLMNSDLRMITMSRLRSLITRTAGKFTSGDYITILLESRGFLFAGCVPENGSVILARKAGKLPGEVHQVEYKTEYSKDTLCIQKSALECFNRSTTPVLIVDDILATGGTALAAAKLAKDAGFRVVGFIFLLEIMSLNGRAKIGSAFPEAHVVSVTVDI